MLNQAGVSNQRVSYANTAADVANFAPGEIRVFGLGASAAIGLPSTPRCFAALNNIYYACTFGSTFTSKVAAKNYQPAFNKSTEFTSVPSSGKMKSATAGDEYNVIAGIPGSTPITLTLASLSATDAGPTSVYQGPTDTTIYWPATTGVGRTTAGSLAAKTSNGIATPAYVTRSQTFQISQLTTPQLLLTFNTRKKGLISFSTPDYSNSAFNIPSFVGNSDGFNPIHTAWSGAWNEFKIPESTTWPTNYSSPDAMSLASYHFAFKSIITRRRAKGRR